MLEVRVCKLRGDWRLDAEFSMPTPGIVALFGRSGCGKSTLVDIIAGLVAADSGRVALDGHVLLDVAQHCDVKPERRRIRASAMVKCKCCRISRSSASNTSTDSWAS